MGIYVKFTKTTHQIWSCHVTLASNSENFYFFPNSVLNFRKVTKFGGNCLKNKKVTFIYLFKILKNLFTKLHTLKRGAEVSIK